MAVGAAGTTYRRVATYRSRACMPARYDDLIMDHIRNARNYRVLVDAARHATGSNPLCGDEMLVYLDVSMDRIADVAFQCACCGIAMASASMMTEMVMGKSIDETRRMANEIADLLHGRAVTAPDPSSSERLALLETVTRFPARAGCAVLPWLTLRQALAGENMAEP